MLLIKNDVLGLVLLCIRRCFIINIIFHNLVNQQVC